MTRKSFLAALFAPLLAKFVPKSTAALSRAKPTLLTTEAIMNASRISAEKLDRVLSIYAPRCGRFGYAWTPRTIHGDTINVRLPVYVKKSNLDNSIRT